MSHWGMTAAWCALQVTLVALAARVLTLPAMRRTVATGSHLAVVALAAIILLTALAFCPLPDYWSWHGSLSQESDAVRQSSGHARDIATTPTRETEAGMEPGSLQSTGVTDTATAVGFRRLSELISSMRRAASSAASGRSRWPFCLAVLIAVGTSLCLVRLLLGLKAVHDLRHRSHALDDAALQDLLQSLRTAMRCSASVTVRESSDLTTAATVGWLRPTLLLPLDWRGWSAAELRAVLAHELAHVKRRDYAAGVLAHVGLALHCYHPLVHWLVRHLYLQQELAADMLGAQFAGGRRTYLTALAQLALRQEGAPPSWPARSFLPVHGTLMRRIQMLRGKEALGNAGWLRARRWLTVAMLVGVALGSSALRGPAQVVGDQRPDAKPEANGSVAPRHLPPPGRQPFDCRYIGDEAVGMVALRPAAILAYPSMQPHAQAVNLAVQEVLMETGIRDPQQLGLEVADLEEVVAGLRAITNPSAPKGSQHGLYFAAGMIHTIKPHDWVQMLEARIGKLEKHTYQKRDYYTCVPAAKQFPRLCVFCPDDRTLVCEAEQSMRRMLEHGSETRPARAWDRGWAQVEGGLFAVAVDFHGSVFDEVPQSIAEQVASDHLESLALLPVLDRAQVVVGIDGVGDEFRLKALFDCDKEQKAIELAEAEKERIRLGLGLLQKLQAKSATPLEKVATSFGVELLKNAGVERRGTEVEVHAGTKLLFADIVRELLAMGVPK